MRITILLLVVCFCGGSAAQSIERQAIASGGASLFGPSLQLHQSIGQAVHYTLSSSGATLTQGFQQPNVEITTMIAAPVSGDLEFAVFPNPTRDVVHVRSSFATGPLEILVVDASGRACSDRFEWHFVDRGAMIVDLSPLAPGIYLLRLYDAKDTLVGTCRVVKLH